MEPAQRIRASVVEALARSSMLQYMGRHDGSAQDLRTLLQRGELVEFNPGERIIRQGDTSDAMYLLVSGGVSVACDGEEICTLDEPGDVFGEFGAITGELRSATVTARDTVTCFRVGGGFAREGDLGSRSLLPQLLRQAVIKVLLGRIKKSNEELVEARRAVERAEKKVVFLTMDNETLRCELERLGAGRGRAGADGST